MRVFAESAGLDRQIVTHSQLVSVSRFEKSAGSGSLVALRSTRVVSQIVPAVLTNGLARCWRPGDIDHGLGANRGLLALALHHACTAHRDFGMRQFRLERLAQSSVHRRLNPVIGSDALGGWGLGRGPQIVHSNAFI